MSEVIKVSDHEVFKDIVENNRLVVVDFSAPAWCRPCQQLEPHFKAAAEQSEAVFVEVDVDEAPWATSDYGVLGVPCVMLYENGQYYKHILSRTVVKLLGEIGF